MSSEAGIVIIGAGQAGVQIADSLRQEGFEGRITLLGDEPHLPYQRPPLSKKWLLEPGASGALALRSADALAQRRIELLVGTRAMAIDRAAHRVHLADGRALPYSRLALATGSLPRPLPVPGAHLAGVFVLRSLTDAAVLGAEIRKCVAAGLPVVVVGGGFIGLEAAASARKLGASVTVLEGLDRLMSRVSAPIISEAFARLHRSHGVELVFNAQVRQIVGADGRVTAVRCGDGREFPAGLVLAGIGVQADDLLAAACGLAVDRGILVDDCSRTSDEDVVAAGDCAVRRLADGTVLRLESVQNAVEQARSAAATLVGRAKPFTATPWFWSDQYDVKLQMVGLSSGYDQVVTRGDASGTQFSAYYFRSGKLLAVDSLNSPQDHVLAKRLLDRGPLPSPQIVADTTVDLRQWSQSAATDPAGAA